MLKAYSIFDKKVGRYYRPTFCSSIIEIQRNLEILVKDQNSSLCLFPADFAVYSVGSFDDEKGVFVYQDKPEFQAEVLDFVAPERRPKGPMGPPSAIEQFMSRTGRKGTGFVPKKGGKK